MTKRILFAMAVLSGSVQASAAELVAGLSTLTREAGVTFDGTKLTATNVYAKRAYKAAAVVKGHTYRYSVTFANYTGSGFAQAYVTGIKTTCSGSWVTAPNGYRGEFEIADNFNTNAALSAQPIDYREGDQNGSFRYTAPPGAGFLRPDDPIVCPGQPGVAHLHLVWGNTGFSAYSTYKSLRTTGGTTLGDPRYPVQRSAIWQPAMLDGKGHVLQPVSTLLYYKTIPQWRSVCKPIGSGYTDSDTAYVGYCVPLPNGQRWIAGFDMATMQHGPTTDLVSTAYGTINPTFNYGCRDSFRAPPVGEQRFQSLDAALASGQCTIGKYLYISMEAPSCTDGQHVDSPNHQDHMAYATAGSAFLPGGTIVGTPNPTPASALDTLSNGNWPRCPAAYPYVIPTFSIQEAYKIDANFPYWHLSSDDNMTMAMPRGATLHFDYWAAWSPPVQSAWNGGATGGGCINGRNNGNGGDLCNGTKINYLRGATPRAAGYNPDSGLAGGDTIRLSAIVPRTRTGWSRNIQGNGTFTGELKALSSGELGLYFVGGFSGDITAFTVTDVTNVGKNSSVKATTN